MITAARPHPFPLHCFNRSLAAGRERSNQSRSPLAVALRAVRTPYGFDALDAVRCASGSSAAHCRSVGREQRTCHSRRIPVSTRPRELLSTNALPCVELTGLLPAGERLAYASRAYRNRRVSGATALRAR